MNPASWTVWQNGFQWGMAAGAFASLGAFLLRYFSCRAFHQTARELGELYEGEG